MKDIVNYRVIEFCYVTDFVANGSFASLRENVTYINSPDYAVLVRLTDFTKKWRKDFVYVSKDSYDFLKKSSILPGDLIMSNVGELGIVFLVPNLKQPMTLGPNSILIRPNENISFSKFLYLYFLSVNGKKKIDDISTGAAQKKFNKTSFRELEIPLPPLPEQQRIVAILDEAFEAIAKAKANAEQNLKNAKELFESYLQGVFENKGEGWEEVKLSELAKDITDGDHMPPPKTEEGFPFITISNINKQNHKIDFTDTFKVSLEYFKKLKENRKPRKGDVLYTVTGSYGIPVLIEDDLEFCFQRHIGLIRPKENVNSKWLYYWILSPQALFQANDTATGTAQKTVSLTALRNFVLPKMTQKEQQSIVQKLDALSTETKKLEGIYQQKIADLEELKKSILQKAFSGELKTDKAIAV